MRFSEHCLCLRLSDSEWAKTHVLLSCLRTSPNTKSNFLPSLALHARLLWCIPRTKVSESKFGLWVSQCRASVSASLGLRLPRATNWHLVPPLQLTVPEGCILFVNLHDPMRYAECIVIVGE